MVKLLNSIIISKLVGWLVKACGAENIPEVQIFTQFTTRHNVIHKMPTLTICSESIFTFCTTALILVPHYKNVTSKQIFMKVHESRDCDALHYILYSRGVSAYDLITLLRQVTVCRVHNFAIISYLMPSKKQKN